jgi:hypothetical protein
MSNTSAQALALLGNPSGVDSSMPADGVPVPTSTQTQATAPSVSSVQLPTVSLTDPQFIAAIEKARTEEKQKLYKELSSTKTENEELRTQLRSRMSPDEQQQAREHELQTRMTALETQLSFANAELLQVRAETDARIQQLQVVAYAERRMREELGRGNKLLPHLVRGNTEAEIESSIAVALAEYTTMRAEILRDAGFQESAQSSRPTGLSVSTAPAPTPAAFPVVPQTQQQQFAPQENVAEEIKRLTSPENVRNGTYAKNRDHILQLIQSQGISPPNGQAFAQQPRSYMQTQTIGPVEQPQGHPTYSPQPVNLQVVPSSPLPAPATTSPQVVPPSVPNVNPRQPSIAEMRQLAVSSATRSLGQPPSVAMAVTGKTPAQASGDYIAPANGVPVTETAFNGQHPMHR